jgi:GTP cyclohydrolase II
VSRSGRTHADQVGMFNAAGLERAANGNAQIDGALARFSADCRDYSLPIAILRELGLQRVRLLTNNPAKARALSDAGIEVVARIPCEAKANPYSLPYLRTKKEIRGGGSASTPPRLCVHRDLNLIKRRPKYVEY